MGYAHASLGIDRSILIFESGKAPRQDVIASNSGSTNLFLEVEVLEVTDPGSDQEQPAVVIDPESIGLVAAQAAPVMPILATTAIARSFLFISRSPHTLGYLVPGLVRLGTAGCLNGIAQTSL